MPSSTSISTSEAIAVLALLNASWMGALRRYRGEIAAQSGDEPAS